MTNDLQALKASPLVRLLEAGAVGWADVQVQTGDGLDAESAALFGLVELESDAGWHRRYRTRPLGRALLAAIRDAERWVALPDTLRRLDEILVVGEDGQTVAEDGVYLRLPEEGMAGPFANLAEACRAGGLVEVDS